MDYLANEKKWQAIWQETKANTFDYNKIDKKYYVLEMFSYPSGANLHLGHLYNFGPSDSFARFKKMQGYEVYQPMGFDSFGLPAENYAIKTGIHPLDSTLKNIKTMEKQLSAIGAMFESDSSMYTSSPEYYKWTQWLFLQLYKNGLAYQKESPVNWCSSCMTVIANEQVVDGACERCGDQIVRKNMLQWSFKITDYSQKLLDGLDKIDWPEKTKIMQRNWIGKSEGGEISFPIDGDESIKVFTTRADTLMGVSYVVLAPEHPFVDKYTTVDYKEKVKEYKELASKQSEIERLSLSKEKTGQFIGCYCTHPITCEKIPVFIADYCLASYGTGAVMGVPAHDTRDFDFAKKYSLPIKTVISSGDGTKAELPFTEYGKLINSAQFDGLDSKSAMNKILSILEKKGLGKATVNYRLRDWSVSRQRYWGAPIPIIHCDTCGIVPVPEKDLPVKLPYNVNFTPGGKSPLAASEEFMNVKCPRCGKAARRDPDTLDTFVCSSWYYLRYPDNKNDQKPFDSELINKILPVDKYIGGAEHSCMHLLYARFITKVLFDLGYINFDEPFKSLVHQGLILGPDGEKMSKSKGNVINPDDYINVYGSDVLRMYLMFSFSYIDGGPWNDNGIKAIAKFLDRIERLFEKALENKNATNGTSGMADVEYAFNYCVKHVREDMEKMSFNTAIARIMEFVNALYLYESNKEADYSFLFKMIIELIKIIAPFTPHFAEELHSRAGCNYSVFNEMFPDFDKNKLVKKEIEIAVQINSKIRGRIIISANLSEAEVIATVLNNETIKPLISENTVKKVIVIPNRLANIIL